jgi:hypothetical protein
MKCVFILANKEIPAKMPPGTAHAHDDIRRQRAGKSHGREMDIDSRTSTVRSASVWTSQARRSVPKSSSLSVMIRETRHGHCLAREARW